jgi:2-polyprenyl-3-methyl-5-hydroxy-6-metoxy-1,4-benzoquinol methylase
MPQDRILDEETLANYQRLCDWKEQRLKLGYDIDAERDFILTKAKPLEGTILEAGTGKGHFTVALARQGYAFTTFDISPEEQHFAKLNVRYWGLEHLVRFLIEDGEHLSFADASFDVVVSVNVLHHLENPWQVMKELVRVLCPTGKIVLSDFTEEGFALIEKIHAGEGKQHPRGAVAMREVGAFLWDAGFVLETACSQHQDVLLARRSDSLRGAPITPDKEPVRRSTKPRGTGVDPR